MKIKLICESKREIQRKTKPKGIKTIFDDENRYF